MSSRIDKFGVPQERAQETSSKFNALLALAAVLMLTAALYAPSLHYAFLNWDDNEHILGHANIHRGLNAQDIIEIFKDTSLNAYFPLTTLSFALEYQVAGEDPFVYRLNNLYLHLGVVCLIYLFALRLGLSTNGALVAALLFAIHPMHVESVVWITERKDVLYSFFYLLALNCYWVYSRDRSKSAYLMSIVFTLLSMLAKPMAVSLPFILMLMDWFNRRRFDRQLFVEKLPHLLICLPLFVVTFLAHDRIPGGSGGQGFLIFIWCLSFYPIKFLFPFSQSPLYSLPEPIAWTNPPYVIAALVIVTAAILTIRLRHVRWWNFALAYFLISIAIMLKIDAQEASLVADRYMYLPSLGFCLLAGAGWSALMKGETRPQRRMMVWASFMVVFALAAFGSSRYIPIWKDSLSLWNHVISQPNPRPTAFNNRGSLYFKRGDYDAALKDFNEALRLDPTHENALFNRNLLLQRIKPM